MITETGILECTECGYISATSRFNERGSRFCIVCGQAEGEDPWAVLDEHRENEAEIKERADLFMETRH